MYKTKLVPKLKAVPVCTPVPRQFCTVKYVRGEKIQQEILSIWCRLIEKDTEEEKVETTTQTTLAELITTTLEEDLVVDYEVEIPEVTTDGNYDYTTDYEDDLPLYFPPPEGNYLPPSKPLLETTSMGYYPIKELNNAVVDNVNPMEDLAVTQGTVEMSEGISSTTFSPDEGTTDSITMSDVFHGEDETESATTYLPDMLQSVKNDSQTSDTESLEPETSYLPPVLATEKPVNGYLPPPPVESVAPVSGYLPPTVEDEKPVENYVPSIESDTDSEKPVQSYLPPVTEAEKPAEGNLPPNTEAADIIKPMESYLPPVVETDTEAEKPVDGYLPPSIGKI